MGPSHAPEITALKDGDAVRCAFARSGWFSRPTLMDVLGTTEREVKSFSSEGLQQRI